MQPLQLFPVPLRGEIHPGDPVAEKVLAALAHLKLRLRAGDILIVKHKIVSKAEGRLVELGSVMPSTGTRAWARRYGLDARVVEVALKQARRVVRRKRGILITETHHGLVCANSGVDLSNVDGGRHALLLPQDPDASARKIHQHLRRRLHLSIPVIVTDSFGRPWREGLTEVAIGVAGMQALEDHRGKRDPHRYELHASVDAVADELACAAGLVCGKLAETPACVIRGFAWRKAAGSAKELIRPKKNDLFR